MTITFNSDFEEPQNNSTGQTIQSGNRLYVFNDDGSSDQPDTTFSVWDDQGNLLIEEQRLGDDTDEELAGWVYFGVTLPYTSRVGAVVTHPDGSFTVHYVTNNPIIQSTNPTANPSYVEQRTFSAEGVGQPAEPGIVGVPQGNFNVDRMLLPLSDGTLVSGGVRIPTPQDVTVGLSVIAADGTSNGISFDPTGESFFGFDPRPFAVAVAEAGDNVMLAYQDTTTGNLYLRLFDRDAVQIGAEIVLGSTDNDTPNRPAADRVQMATLDSGRVVVTWSNQRASDATPELFMAILNADGTIARAPEVVNTDRPGGTQYDGQIFPLSDGGFVVVYHTIGGQPYVQEAVLRQYDAQGNPVGGSVSFGSGQQYLNGHQSAVFPNGFGYVLDGFGLGYTIQVSGQSDSGSTGGSTGGGTGTGTTGTAGDDTLTGTDGADLLAGGDGDDSLDGSAGDDGLQGQAGNDTLNGGDGDDNLAASEGNDVVLGGTGNDLMGGGPGNDTMDGGAGNDFMGGGLGDDSMTGGDGNDVINGGAGNDTMQGGSGNDTMGASFGNDVVAGGADSDDLGGGAGSDQISGGDGDDQIGGGEGDDTIDGGSGNDFLAGGGRHDVITGGAGDDQINGGDGDDTMTGGDGADQFVFNGFKDGDNDVITDWTNGQDTFRMTGVENAPGSGLQGYLDALNLTAVSGGVQMEYQGHVITLEGASLSDLGLEDFTFL